MGSMDISFTAPSFSLPLFMVTRNQIKYTKLNYMRKYMKKNVHVYGKRIDNEFEGTTIRYFQHLLGMKKYLPSLTNHKNAKVPKNYSNEKKGKFWHLPPNRYDISKTHYECKRGIGGSYWHKIHVHRAKSRPNFRQPHVHLYNLPTITEKLFGPCLRMKGVFLSNARERRATTRCMVSNIGTCYKNPSDPGPTSYNPTYESKKTSLLPNNKKANPHLFYRLSTVPVKKNSIYIPHISFSAAPGRYETRYPNICPCSSKLVYQPQIDIIIEREKRKKFRRITYNIIKARHYTSPDWEHVKGRGFCNLFKGAKPFKNIPLTLKEVRKPKNIQLYPDSKYIGMINHPHRTTLSLRSKSISSAMPAIKFNCIAKKVARKQLRNNKNIAFNSNQERFRDGYRLPILTQTQQEQLKLTLPLDRQFRDHPIINKQPSEIKSKLFETPKHMQLNYEPKLRKKIFKFLPLPQAKVLVTENVANINETNNDGFYLNILKAEHFYKDNVE